MSLIISHVRKYASDTLQTHSICQDSLKLTNFAPQTKSYVNYLLVHACLNMKRTTLTIFDIGTLNLRTCYIIIKSNKTRTDPGGWIGCMASHRAPFHLLICT